jgi:quercetin dioxygenase-like cupin family protein
MKLVIVERDDEGRSSAAASQVIEAGSASPAGAGFAVEELWSTPSHPPALVDQPARLEPADVGVSPGGTRWLRVHCEPGATFDMHRSTTVDYDVVLSGQLDLLLEDGFVRLEPGDAVLLQGHVHGWRGGPEGATYAVVLLSGAPGPRPG